MQTTFNVPIYASAGGDLHSLNSLLLQQTEQEQRIQQQRKSLDFSRYSTNSSCVSVHVGSLYFSDVDASAAFEEETPAEQHKKIEESEKNYSSLSGFSIKVSIHTIITSFFF